MTKWFLGVDPGWRAYAYAWLSSDGDLITGVVDPRELPKGRLAPMEVQKAIGDEWWDGVSGAVMERFVYFGQESHNPDSERILMVTGQTQFWLADSFSIVPTMFRSYDWKSRLSKHLYKQGFRNPSDRLDKKFSIAAAEFIFDREFETDHEADAACMAYIARMLDRD